MKVSTPSAVQHPTHPRRLLRSPVRGQRHITLSPSTENGERAGSRARRVRSLRAPLVRARLSCARACGGRRAACLASPLAQPRNRRRDCARASRPRSRNRAIAAVTARAPREAAPAAALTIGSSGCGRSATATNRQRARPPRLGSPPSTASTGPAADLPALRAEDEVRAPGERDPTRAHGVRWAANVRRIRPLGGSRSAGIAPRKPRRAEAARGALRTRSVPRRSGVGGGGGAGVRLVEEA
jgi:hypothetical protein